MRAYVLESFETEPRMIDLPQPEIADNELLIRVHAVSVNPVDLAIASGGAKDWLEYRFPVTLGRDLAGVVERVGPSVSTFDVGDKVFGYIAKDYAHDGSFAEYVAVPEGEFVVRQPDGIDHAQAASLGLAAVTATMCLDAAGVGEESVLLVSGATGGVGGYAVQIAKARGAHVLATARPGDEERHVRELGADEVIDWSAGAVADAVRAAHPDGIDALIDLVTPDPEAFATLAKAVLVPSGKAATTLNAADPDRLGGIEATNVWSSPEVGRMELIAGLVREGRVRAPVTDTLPFARLEEALGAVGSGAVGKIAVTLVPEPSEVR